MGDSQIYSPFWTGNNWAAKLAVRVKNAQEIAGSNLASYPHVLINQARNILQSLNPPAQMIARLISESAKRLMHTMERIPQRKETC